jgi:hypothetical protein
MKKVLFIFLFSILSLSSYAQIMNHTSIQLDNSKEVSLTIYRYSSTYVFGLDFFNINDCQKKAELRILDKDKKITKLKYRKYFGCEKEVAYFEIDTCRINLDNIKLVRYYNLNTMEQYNFKL